MAKFWNPYAFVPFGSEDRPQPDGSVGHERLRTDEVAGTISFTLVAEGPVLCFDEASRMMQEEHPSFGVVRDPRQPDHPWIPPTTVKGVLRSAYEAVTDSRLGVFEQPRRLGFRRSIREAAMVVPAQVVAKGDHLAVELLYGVLEPADRLGRQGAWPVHADSTNGGASLLPAAFVGCSLLDELARSLGVEDGADGLANRTCTASLVLHEHVRNGQRDFFAYVVTELTADGVKVSERVRRGQRWVPVAQDHTVSVGDRPVPLHIQNVEGVLLVTGANTARNKHEERFCFALSDDNREMLSPEVSDHLLTTFDDVMASYLESHGLGADDAMKDGTGPQNGVNWARHLRQPGARRLQSGSLAWCFIQDRAPHLLQPVAASRGLYKSAPGDLVGQHHRPAGHLDQMSPADRLFGWVALHERGHEAQESDAQLGATRGMLSIVDVHHVCDTSPCGHIDTESPRVLPELASPKPSYGRFYTVPNGGQLGDRSGWFNADGGHRLAGRKFYWHHKNGPRRKDAMETKRNRTALEHVIAGAEFRIELRIDGAPKADVNALLDLLNALIDPEPVEEGVTPARLLVGFGRPIGYGAMAVRDVNVTLEDGENRSDRIRALFPKAQADAAEMGDESAIVQASFDAWRLIAQGKRGISYPKTADDDDEGFTWFQQNEEADGTKQGLSLNEALDSRATRDGGR
jgi:CRISPR-associated protein (TIGR03986 family)